MDFGIQLINKYNK